MLDLEIREQIRRYLVGDIDAGDLEVWLTGDMNDALEQADRATRDLVFEASRLVFERMNGDWTDRELMAKLAALSQTYWLMTAPKVLSSSSSDVIRATGDPGGPHEVAFA